LGFFSIAENQSSSGPQQFLNLGVVCIGVLHADAAPGNFGAEFIHLEGDLETFFASQASVVLYLSRQCIRRCHAGKTIDSPRLCSSK